MHTPMNGLFKNLVLIMSASYPMRPCKPHACQLLVLSKKNGFCYKTPPLDALSRISTPYFPSTINLTMAALCDCLMQGNAFQSAQLQHPLPSSPCFLKEIISPPRSCVYHTCSFSSGPLNCVMEDRPSDGQHTARA